MRGPTLLLILFCLFLPCIPAAQRSTDQDLAHAIELHRAGQIDEAIAAYRAILHSHADNALARANLGAALASQGFLAEATEHYKKVLHADPLNVPVRYNLALAEYKLGRLKDATASLEAVVKKDAKNRNAKLLLGDCYLRTGENRKAIALLDPLVSKDENDNALLYVLGTALLRDRQAERGQALIEQILRKGESAEAHMMMAQALMLAGKNQESLKDYARAAELNPKLPGVHDSYGHALLGNQQHEQAAVEFRKELENNPNDYDANLFAGILAKREHEMEAAERYFKKALDLRPGSYETRYQLGSLYVMGSRWPEALAVLEPLVNERPDFLEAHISLATVYYRLKHKEEGDRERAIVAKLNAELQTNKPNAADPPPASGEDRPGRAPSTTGAAEGTAAVVAEERVNAEQALSKAVEIADQPRSTGIPAGAATGAGFDDLARRAEEARLADRNDEAIVLYQQALKQRPSWPEGWWQLGSSHYISRQYRECRDAYRKHTELVPHGAPGWAMLGLCEFGMSEYVRAFEHMQRGRQLGLDRGTELSRVNRYHVALLLNLFGQPEAALAVLYDLAREQDENDLLLQALGIAALRLKILPESIQMEQREVLMLLGRAQYNVGSRHLREAESQFLEAVKRYPNVANVHYNYGVFLRASNSDAALDELRTELRISPAHVAARLQIAFEYLKRNEVSAGLPFAREAVKLDPKSFEARNALGRLLLEAGETAAAIQQLEAGLKIEPESTETAFALARAYAKAGRKQDAARARAEFERLDKIRRARNEGQGIGAPAAQEEKPPGA